MEHLFFSFNAVAPLFLLIAAGYIMRQIRFVSDTFLSAATQFTFKLLLPLMLFQNIRSTFHGEISNLRLICAAVAGIAIVILLSFCIVPLFVKRRGRTGSMIQGIYRSNFLIYGMPLVTGMYGQDASLCISMLMGIMIPLYNIAAVVILSIFSENRQSISIKSLTLGMIQNPLIIGCFFGLLFGILSIPLPTFIDKPVGDLAMAASPLALVLMGGEFKFKNLRNNIRLVLSATITRLIIVPVVAISIFVYAGFRAIDLSILLCIFATPAAVSSYIMAANMGCDGELSGQIVVLTTIGSSLTIFLFVFILRTMGVL